MSILAYSNIFLDPRGTSVVYADTGGTASVAQPLDNMSKMQLPIFAQFNSAAAEFTATLPAQKTARVFALLGHTLPGDAEVTFSAGGVPLGTVTVKNYPGLARHAILVLDEPVQVTELAVSITGGGSGFTIGALWASDGFTKSFALDGFGYDFESLSSVSWAGAAGYVSPRESQTLPTFKFTPLTRAEAIGPDAPNVRSVFRCVSEHKCVLVIPYNRDLSTAVYGLIESTSGPTTIPNAPTWRASATVREMR